MSISVAVVGLNAADAVRPGCDLQHCCDPIQDVSSCATTGRKMKQPCCRSARACSTMACAPLQGAGTSGAGRADSSHRGSCRGRPPFARGCRSRRQSDLSGPVRGQVLAWPRYPRRALARSATSLTRAPSESMPWTSILNVGSMMDRAATGFPAASWTTDATALTPSRQ